MECVESFMGGLSEQERVVQIEHLVEASATWAVDGVDLEIEIYRSKTITNSE